MRDASTTFLALAAAAIVWAGTAAATSPAVEAPAGGARIVAIGNVHGAAEDLEALLRAGGLIDAGGRWSGGNARLVLTGNLLGFGIDERRVLDSVLRLEREAAAVGGAVHALLGAHEVLALTGDPRRVSREAAAAFHAEEPRDVRETAAADYAAVKRPKNADPFDALYPPGWFGRRALFAPGRPYGDWLLARPAVVVLDGTLFTGGGLPPLLAELGPDALNARVTSDLRRFVEKRAELEGLGLVSPIASTLEVLEQADRRATERARELGPERGARARTLIEEIAGAQGGPAFTAEGPSWYTRTARAPEAEERATFEAALARAGARRAVAGGLPTPGMVVTTRFGGRLVRVSTGLPGEVFKGRPAALEIAGGSLRVIAPGDAVPAQPVPEPAVPPTDEELAARDREIEEFLATAEVVALEDIGVGITKPRRATLRKNGRELRAAFKTIDQEARGNVRLGSMNELSFSDRYVYEVAAYRLDRLLGLRMVPVTVERTIGKERGALQLWIEHAIDEGRRLRHRAEPDDPVQASRYRERMYAFDILIHNIDRNLGNTLYTFGDGRVHLIDHSRSFRLARERPRALEGVQFEVDAELARGLRGLTRERLEAELGRLVSREQIKAVLARRDLLLR